MYDYVIEFRILSEFLSNFVLLFTVGDSGRFSRRANDKLHRRRLASAQRLFQKYENVPEDILEVVDVNQKIFRIASETSPTTKYNVSLSTHYCDSVSTTSTCKHILALQLITKEYYLYVSVEKAPCPSTNLDPIIETTVEDAYNEILTNESTAGCDIEKGDLLQVINEMESTLLEVKSSIGTYGKEEAKYKIEMIKACMQSLMEPFTFQKPSRIMLPSRGSILSIQENVKRTRMGHGRTSKQKGAMKEDTSAVVKEGRPPLVHAPHKLVSTSKRKRIVFPKIPKIICDACFTRTMVDKGDTIVSCRNCDRNLKCT